MPELIPLLSVLEAAIAADDPVATFHAGRELQAALDDDYFVRLLLDRLLDEHRAQQPAPGLPTSYATPLTI